MCRKCSRFGGGGIERELDFLSVRTANASGFPIQIILRFSPTQHGLSPTLSTLRLFPPRAARRWLERDGSHVVAVYSSDDSASGGCSSGPRTSMMLACLLLHLEDRLEPEEALRRVERLRGPAFHVHRPGMRRWVTYYYRFLKVGRVRMCGA